MENISQMSKYAIDSILKGIENLDEYEADYFYAALAKQSSEHDRDTFKGACDGRHQLRPTYRLIRQK